MNIRLLIFLFSIIVISASSQSGCTDSLALNYNSAAISNDGSCLYASSSLKVFSKGLINAFAGESSGLVYTEGALWTHNDSGNLSNIYKIDTATGILLQTISIVNYSNSDWEDIAADSNFIYIADCGNNNGNRTDLRILKIDKSQFIGNTNQQVPVTAQAINFLYADQTNFTSNANSNFDCEALISVGDSLYIFTKNSGDFQTRVYQLPKSAGSYSISPFSSFDVKGKITGADYRMQTKEVVLIGYLSSHKSSFLWFLNEYPGHQFFLGNKRRVEVGDNTSDWQTEGIATGPAGQLFISCENSDVPATLYTASKSSIKPVGMKEQVITVEKPSVCPNPSSGKVWISVSENYLGGMLNLLDSRGFTIRKQVIADEKIDLDLSDLADGIYFLQYRTRIGTCSYQKIIKN